MNPQVPLQLESFFVEALTYRAREGFDVKLPPCERVDVTPNVLLHKETPSRFMVRLEVRVGQQESSNARCELDLRLVGFFVLPEGLEPKIRAAMLVQNAPSILYGVARQVVTETTSNGPWGKVFLPTMDFVAMAANQARTAVAAKTKPDCPVVSDKPASTKR
ncbi:MAG: protein-export chaperone SecB [candidate division WOR-3 bacterium]|nr:protein-export chaperone SecB [candidate division WOR-3 bacterium]